MAQSAQAGENETISIITVMPTNKAGGDVATIPGGQEVHLHALGLPTWIKAKKDVDFGQFLYSWNKLKGQIGTMIGDLTGQTFGKMALEQIEVSISVSGEGSIGIATAKAEASIVLTFKDPKSAASA
jgi:hypothetical protein